LLTPYQVKSPHQIIGIYSQPKKINEGSVYVGEWSNSLPHGKGIMYFSDGSLYEGMFN
jgi:hypothetical protein